MSGIPLSYTFGMEGSQNYTTHSAWGQTHEVVRFVEKMDKEGWSLIGSLMPYLKSEGGKEYTMAMATFKRTGGEVR